MSDRAPESLLGVKPGLGEAGVERFYNMLLDSQWWPPETIRAYQRSRLQELVVHAAQNVRFYRDRLVKIAPPNGEIDWDAWLRIAFRR